MDIESQLIRAEEIMKQHDLKITAPRMKVIRALLTHPHVHSVYELRRCDESLKKVNPVTLYRILEVLVRLGLAHRVSGNEFRACDLNDAQKVKMGCHLLLICDECGTVEEIFDDRCHENDIAQKYNFKIFSHVNELHGVCRTCQK